MLSKWIITLDGMESYRFGEDGNLYRLGYVTTDGKHRGIKLIKKDKEKKRWFISRFGKVEKWSENQLRVHLAIDKNPVQLTKEKDLPF